MGKRRFPKGIQYIQSNRPGRLGEAVKRLISKEKRRTHKRERREGKHASREEN